MRNGRGLTYGLTVTTLFVLALLGWTRFTPASGQDDPARPGQPPPGPPMRMGPAALAASGDYVYVLRGNTLFQLKSSDLSVAAQKDLPAPTPPPAVGAPPAAGANPP